MRQKVAKALRRECSKMGMSKNGYRRVKRKYANLQPMRDPLTGKWISVSRQKKALCLT